MDRRRRHAGIVDQKVQTAKTLVDFRKEPFHVGGNGNIGRHDQKAVAVVAPFGRGGFENLPPPSCYRNAVTILQQSCGNRLADACSSACDERDLSFAHAVSPSSSSSTCA